MRTSKKIVSLVLAVMMVMSMMSVMAVSTAFAAGEVAEIVTAGEGATGVAGDQFATVNEAVAAAGEGGEVKLIADIYIAAGELNVGIDGDYTTTLNLNGHNITNEAGSCITLYSKYPGGKTFTIKGTGTVTCTPKYTGDACISDSSGRNVVIKGGTYTNTVEGKNALYVSSDEGWTISGGTFNGNIMVKSDLTMTAGTVNGNIIQDGKPDYSTPYPWTNIPSDITISGGTVNGEIVENAENNDNIVVTGGTFANDPAAYVDTTVYKVKYTATNGKVSYKTNIDYSNVSGSGTYQLLDDLTANSRIVPSLFASNVVFDLNGHTLTSTATDEAFLFSRAGSAATHNSYTIKNGTVVAAGDGVDLLANYADLTLENVDIVANGTYGVVTNGTKKGNNITATDSSITAGTLGIYKPSNGSLTLTDTDVTGKTAVYVKSGDVTIDGGTFTGTGAAADYSYNGNGANITGDAVVIENAGSAYAALGNVAIKGGTFKSDNANGVLAPAKDGPSEAPTNFIYGGTYDGDVVDSYVAPGLVDENNGNGTFTIVLDENPIKDNTQISGYQEKIGEPGVRIWTAVDRDFLETYADSYGYVVAKVQGKDLTANFSAMKKDGGNGEKTIDCTGTYNNGVGHDTYNDITLAVDGMEDGNQVAARFYVVIGGVTYYAKYATVYDGIIATYAA